ncbi:TPA: FAD-dependent thymidylate synthase [Clostridium botulinum]|nr:FAD-dependent thymidylate synthase [Clostridium botulinum]HBJ1652766.1 FAD-dependent thymidylate synthase [Clostridium botulinum]
MKIEMKEYKDYWQQIKDATMNTIGKNTGKYPENDWKRKLLISEHSPIRKLKISWRWLDLKYWVSVHITRHWLGIIHFVSTQRTDRTGLSRDELPQNSLVNHECEANAQSLINISRRRLCNCASTETRQAWQLVKEKISEVEPELSKCMVRECVYRNGLCPEMFTCGYNKTNAFENELKEYLEISKDNINDKTNIFIKETK